MSKSGGWHHTEEAKKKISEALRLRIRKPLTSEARKKMSDLKTGCVYPNRKSHPHTEESKKKISDSLKGRKKPPRTEEHKRKIGKAVFKGGKYKDRKGYVLIWKGPKLRYLREHRCVMEQHLGRKLLKNEEVHHKNCIKDDNRIENLEIMVTGFHKSTVRCPHCEKEFLIK